MLVYTTGNGVHGSPSIRRSASSSSTTPTSASPPGKRIYSVNRELRPLVEGQQRLIDHFKGLDGENSKPFSSRYIE